MTLDGQKFEEGMSTAEYIAQIKINQEPFKDIYEKTEMPRETLDFFSGLPGPLNLAVFTADWCGDALTTTPVILKLADASSNWTVKVFNRDEELDLTDSFLPKNRAGTVPVFVVCDVEMNEIARFIETANALVPEIDAMDEQIDKELAAENIHDPDRTRRRRRTPYRVDRAGEWSQVIAAEFQRVVQEGMGLTADRRPAIGGTRWPPEE